MWHCISNVKCMLQKRMNLTKTIRKLPINEDGQRAGYYVHDDLSNAAIQYDDAKVPILALSICCKRSFQAYLLPVLVLCSAGSGFP